jgi:hypothetical protein
MEFLRKDVEIRARKIKETELNLLEKAELSE